MEDLYGEGAIDILKHMYVDEHLVIKSLMYKIKSLEESNKSIASTLFTQLEQKDKAYAELKASYVSHIEYMDEVARAGGLTIKCRGCGEYYELPCELSEMSDEGNYCNSGHGGAYHCTPQ